ncbi:MAG: hypothetical protein K2K66_03600 [Ruminococcus sp.]|nr:hypothetical protein [Ruminococcus sp.]
MKKVAETAHNATQTAFQTVAEKLPHQKTSPTQRNVGRFYGKAYHAQKKRLIFIDILWF